LHDEYYTIIYSSYIEIYKDWSSSKSSSFVWHKSNFWSQ